MDGNSARRAFPYGVEVDKHVRGIGDREGCFRGFPVQGDVIEIDPVFAQRHGDVRAALIPAARPGTPARLIGKHFRRAEIDANAVFRGNFGQTARVVDETAFLEFRGDAIALREADNPDVGVLFQPRDHDPAVKEHLDLEVCRLRCNNIGKAHSLVGDDNPVGQLLIGNGASVARMHVQEQA